MKQIYERSAAIKSVLEKYMIRQSGSNTNHISLLPGSDGTTDSISDKELIEKAARAANGERFRNLWSGNIAGYPSHSEADQALCNMLAFWTGNDTGRMDRLFRQSGLMRAKWDRKQSGTTYGAITITKAVRGNKAVYEPGHKRHESPLQSANV